MARLRDGFDGRIFDAVELDYHPDDEDRIETFLAEAGFDYTIGSVHFAGEYDYTSASQYADASDAERRAAVERYYDALVAAVESALFDVLGHLDVPERVPELRGLSTRADYERVAAALADSPTVPEINAGRVHRSLGRVHPNPEMLDCFRERGVGFVPGTDSHAPAELDERVPALRALLEERDVPVVDVETVVS
jgi:histidinol-phosphatase (PHP family)